MTRPDRVAEMLQAAEADGAAVRALGGIAIQLRCPSAREGGPLHRECGDVDLATTGRAAAQVKRLLTERGYEAATRFNALHGRRRLLFTAPDGHHADVFIDTFAMCHSLDLRGRIDIDDQTLSLGDLLLTKLQIAELNRKDVSDLAALLLDHALTDDDRGINLPYVAGTLGRDWGWWRTVSGNLDRFAALVEVLGLARAQEERVHAQARLIVDSIEAAPKTTKWRLRARVGDRMPWREEPEEIAG